jgi:hypothetical protein
MKRLRWRLFQDWAAVIYFASRLNFALFCVASEKKVAIEFFFILIFFSYIYSHIPHTHTHTHVLHAHKHAHKFTHDFHTDEIHESELQSSSQVCSEKQVHAGADMHKKCGW